MPTIVIGQLDANYIKDADTIRPFAKVLSVSSINESEEILLSFDIGSDDHDLILTVNRGELLKAIGDAIAEDDL